jgi:UDP-2-acetamido-2,6-beta-L-arabino-hexul-4-ose reductase
MKVLITGANGFVAHNLRVHLSERDDIEAILFTRKRSIDELSGLLEGVDFIFHLAGVNRPKDDIEFVEGNVELTERLCRAIESTGRMIPVIYTSSIQAEVDNPYGESKLAAEKALLDFSKNTGSPVHIFRLPNVFGKWCKPNYNSAVATFCHNISHDLPVQVNDPLAPIRLVYIDDVMCRFISVMDGAIVDDSYCDVDPVYEITVGELVEKLTAYKASRDSLVVGRVGAGLDRALYSTYLSYLDATQFSYELLKHEDPRGVFVEMLKTQDSGQFSYFTAHPGVTRGGHYHHTKNEKFLVLKGEAVFKFRQIVTDDYYELTASGEQPIVVETVPGWTHDITNVGTDEMIVMLWANEVFDPDAPDTFAKAL